MDKNKMRSTELAQRHWDETPLYYTEDVRYKEYPWLYEVAEFEGHSGQAILEIGCGTGCDLLQFARHGAIATGVDVTAKHLEMARARVGSHAKVIEASAADLPFADNSFDYVYSHGVLHHIERPQLVANEILRVLKPGGTFNIHVYALFSESSLIYVLKHGKDWARHVENSTAPVHIELYTAHRLRGLFPNCGLKFSKHQCYHLKFASRLLGWYLVAKGVKPKAVTPALT